MLGQNRKSHERVVASGLSNLDGSREKERDKDKWRSTEWTLGSNESESNAVIARDSTRSGDILLRCLATSFEKSGSA